MFERYYKELLNYLSHSVGDRDAAADILQDAYVRAITRNPAGAEAAQVDEPRAMLYRIAKNLRVDAYRKAVLRQHESLEHVELFAREADEPEHQLHSAQLTRSLLDAIEALPLRCRQAFILYKFEHLSHAEIAEQMGISINMVEKHIIKGMLACKQCLRSHSD